MLRNFRRSLGVEARPWTMSRQEKVAGCPALTFSMASAPSVIGQVMSSSVMRPPCTPSRPNCSAWITPRRLGSPASTCTRRCAWVRFLSCGPSSIGRFEEKAVLREERAALRLLDGAEQILLLRQARGQCIARLGDQFRRRRFDHRDDQFVLRECLLERHLALPPRNVGGNQLVDVGGHGKMRRRVPRRCDGQYERHADDRPRIVHAKIDRADDKGSDCLHGPKRNAMVRDGMVGGSNRPLRRQEKGKMEALCSSSFVGAVHRRQSAASMRHPPPNRDPYMA